MKKVLVSVGKIIVALKADNFLQTAAVQLLLPTVFPTLYTVMKL